jgi:hypothetical protein
MKQNRYSLSWLNAAFNKNESNFAVFTATKKMEQKIPRKKLQFLFKGSQSSKLDGQNVVCSFFLFFLVDVFKNNFCYYLLLGEIQQRNGTCYK